METHYSSILPGPLEDLYLRSICVGLALGYLGLVAASTLNNGFQGLKAMAYDHLGINHDDSHVFLDIDGVDYLSFDIVSATIVEPRTRA